MADYYTQLSTTISIRNARERSRWDTFLEDPDSYLSKYLGPKRFQDNQGDLAADEQDVPSANLGAEFEIQRDAPGKKQCVWIHAEEYVNLEMLALALQLFLKDCRSKGSIGYAWAHSCSKPRIDAYGGGAVQITAKKIKWSYPIFDDSKN